EAAIREADAVLFVVDAQSGILPVEHDVADLLRRSGKPVLLVANKADSWRGEAQAAEFYELGLGEPLTVSAIQGIGTGDLLDAVGIRRRGRIEEGIEKSALLRTAQALERADVAILLTDATEGITAQDVHIAGYAIDAAVGIVLAVNKWDVVDRGPEMTEAVEA